MQRPAGISVQGSLISGTDTANTTILIEAEHQVRIGTVVRAGGLIELIGGNDPLKVILLISLTSLVPAY